MVQHRVVKAAVEGFGGLPERAFPTSISFSSPGVFSGTSSGRAGVANGRLQSTMEIAGALSGGSNMNKTEEDWPVAIALPIAAEWHEANKIDGSLTPFNRQWNVAKTNLCFGVYTGSSSVRVRGTGYAHGKKWADGCVRCLSWFSLNQELYEDRKNMHSIVKAQETYRYLGLLQTFDSIDATGQPMNRVGTFHYSGRSRTPCIWAACPTEAMCRVAVRTNAYLWLIWTSQVDAAGEPFLRVEPFASASPAASFPNNCRATHFVGTLAWMEGVVAINQAHADLAFYPISKEPSAVQRSLQTITHRIPACYVNLGTGLSELHVSS